jgi:hypothetical protein
MKIKIIFGWYNLEKVLKMYLTFSIIFVNQNKSSIFFVEFKVFLKFYSRIIFMTILYR